MKPVWVLAVVCVALVGCGSLESKRVPLQGKVTYEGKPVAYGMVLFGPDTTKGNKGLFGTAEIHDGVFQTSPDYGPTPGPMIVNVQVYDAQPPANHMLANIIDMAIDIPSGITTWDLNLTAQDIKPIHP
jgi:hypothetical protein